MANRFNKTLDKATDPTLLEPNWDAILYCANQIRDGGVSAMYAVTAIRKKLTSNNSHSVLHTLNVLDVCVKNRGTKVHSEIATKEFMTEYRGLANHKWEPVREKSLEMLQYWALAFRDEPAYKIIDETHNRLELSGHAFPHIKNPAAVYIAQNPPLFADGENCFSCRAELILITRKHRCRACGQIFCGICTNKKMDLPMSGIETKVRVCDSCFDKGPNEGRRNYTKNKTAVAVDAELQWIREVREIEEAELEEREDAELQLALDISLSEAKDRERKTIRREDIHVMRRIEPSASAELEAAKIKWTKEKDHLIRKMNAKENEANEEIKNLTEQNKRLFRNMDRMQKLIDEMETSTVEVFEENRELKRRNEKLSESLEKITKDKKEFEFANIAANAKMELMQHKIDELEQRWSQKPSHPRKPLQEIAHDQKSETQMLKIRDYAASAATAAESGAERYYGQPLIRIPAALHTAGYPPSTAGITQPVNNRLMVPPGQTGYSTQFAQHHPSEGIDEIDGWTRGIGKKLSGGINAAKDAQQHSISSSSADASQRFS